MECMLNYKMPVLNCNKPRVYMSLHIITFQSCSIIAFIVCKIGQRGGLLVYFALEDSTLLLGGLERACAGLILKRAVCATKYEF
jgi:hypothetical protein